MPAEKIATTPVSNGAERWSNVLRVTWGARGGCPEAPGGWVNAGYAMVSIVKDGDSGEITHAVELDPEEIDHLIRTLKRVRRQAFRPGRNVIPPSAMPA